jgi:hypothetical protein
MRQAFLGMSFLGETQMNNLQQRRKGNDRRQSGMGEPPYLTKTGWVSIDRRKTADRRRFDLLSLLPEQIEEIEIKSI